MPYLAIENFKGGLDKRRMELTAEVGSLQTLKNCHISRGGEIEKAKAFVEEYELPAGTFGLAIIRDQPYVFGSAATPSGLDSDIIYQRLQNPDNSTMVDVLAIDVVSGKNLVIAEYVDGTRCLFYDGVLVADWTNGVVRSSMTNNDGIAEHLKTLIDASSDYSAVRTGTTITITGSSSDAFDISASAVNGEGNTYNDQTVVVATTQEAVSGTIESLASGSFRITAGTSSPGTNRITSVKVDGVEILGGPSEVLSTGYFVVTGGTSSPGTNKITAVTVNSVDVLGAAVDHTGNNDTTAAAIAAQINSYSSSPEYTATSYGSTVTISAAAGTGSSPNGYVVSPTVAGNVTVGGVVNMSNGAYSGVQWESSNSVTAAAVVTQCGLYSSSPEYTVTSDGDQVLITALAGTGDSPNGFVVTVVAGGDVVASSITNFSGGVTAESGQPQISTAVIGGTFEPGDLFSVTLGDSVFGASRVSGLTPNAVLRAHKNKVYAANGATLLFSGVAEPSGWAAEDVGSGAQDMSSQASGFEDITALSIYQNSLVIYSRNVVQLWYVDPDPDVNSQLQVLENIGTRSPRSVVGFGDSDNFFLSDTGVRSLRARDSSNSAAVSDVGTPIDPIILAAMEDLTDSDIESACGVIEPTDGRFMLSLGDIQYVFSYFATSKVSSWSTYEQDLQIEWFAKSGTKVYARSGDSIYVLGGLSSSVSYCADPAIVELPYINANKIANWKSWTKVDFAIEGTWLVEYNSDPNQSDEWETIGTVTEHTVGQLNNAVQAFGPVFKLRLTNTEAGPAKIGSILVHYRDSNQT